MRTEMTIADVAIYQANLYALSVMRRLDQSLRDRVLEVFKNRIKDTTRDESLSKVASYLYHDCGNEAEVPRGLLVEVLTQRPDLLRQTEGWLAQMLGHIPERTADIVPALAGKYEDLGKSQPFSSFRAEVDILQPARPCQRTAWHVVSLMLKGNC